MLIHTGDPPVHDANGSVAQRPPAIAEHRGPDDPAGDHEAIAAMLAEGGGSFWRGLLIACAIAVPLWSLLIFGIYRLF